MSPPRASRPRLTGIGLVTPAGPNARATVLALRAGLQLFAELPRFWVAGEEEDEEAAVMGAAIPAALEVEPGLDRYASHARRALREALADAGLDPARARTRLYLGHDPGHDITHVVRVLDPELPGSEPPMLYDVGRCAALYALSAALDALAQGAVDAAVVGGVDGWVSPGRLAELARDERLRSGEKQDGVIPGEAAGFVVIEARDAASARGARAYARVPGAAVADEPRWRGEEPTRGDGLSAALRGVLASGAPGGGRTRLPLVVSDFAGHRDIALEYGLANSRTLPGLPGDTRHWHPADSIGDTGAASGAVTLAWAASALRERWVDDEEIVIWGASERSERAAALLLAEPGAGA